MGSASSGMPLREQLLSRFPALRRIPRGAYVVGGAVRDLLLDREPADVDVACADPLAAAQAVRKKVIRLGDEEELSAYRVVHDGRVYDFAALLGGEIAIDLARRDFTINAMAVGLDDGALLDPHDGRRDLELRLVRMVAPKNFDDDPLRVLKGVRTAIRYGFDFDPRTLDAMRARAPRIVEMAPERVTSELSLILGAGRFDRAVSLLHETSLAAALDLHPRHVVDAAGGEEPSLAAALALVVADPRTYAERWRWSEQLTRDVQTLRALVESHDRMALYDAGERIARQLPPLLRMLGRDDRLDLPDFSIRAILTGKEIADVTGLEPGKELGRIKRELLEAQVRGEVSTREEAISRVAAAAARVRRPEDRA